MNCEFQDDIIKLEGKGLGESAFQYAHLAEGLHYRLKLMMDDLARYRRRSEDRLKTPGLHPSENP